MLPETNDSHMNVIKGHLDQLALGIGGPVFLKTFLSVKLNLINTVYYSRLIF